MPFCARNPVRSGLVLLLVFSALLFAACGEDDGAGDADGPDPATLAPPDPLLYAEAVIRPEGEQAEDLTAALGKLTGGEDVGAALREEIERSIASGGDLSYEDDIEPWLGQTGGVFVTGFSGDEADLAVLVATSDTAATEAAIEKASAAGAAGPQRERTYDGIGYRLGRDGDAVGVVGGFLVGGTEAGFRAAVDASNGESLADRSEAQDALDSAPEGSIFRAYLDGAGLADAALDAGELSAREAKRLGPQLEALEDGPIVLSGDSTSEELGIELSAPAGLSGGEDASGAGELLAGLPGDSWLALGLPMLGETVAAGYEDLIKGFESSLEGFPNGELPDLGGKLEAATGLDPAEDLAWAGDTALFARGSSLLSIGAGLVIETDDEEAARAALARLAGKLRRERSVEVAETPDGFELRAAGQPIGAEVAVEDGRVVAAAGGITIADVLDPPETLADSDRFSSARDALGSDLDPGLYLDAAAIVGLLEASGVAAGDPSFDAATPTLEAIDYLIAGGTVDGDRSSGRLVLGLRDAPSGEGTAAALAP